MFEKFKKKLAIQPQNEKSIEVKVSRRELKAREKAIKALMDQKKLPIVVLDKSWYDVKALIENDLIIEKEKVVLEFLKERGALNNTLKEKQAVKQSLMKKVLEASEALNNNGDESKLNELNTLYQAITRLNEEIPQIEERLEEIETLIAETNRALIEEAVALSYVYMDSCKAESKKLGEEIDVLRQELLEKTNEKKKYDSRMGTLYHYLHNMVGYKHIDKIDQTLGEPRE